MFRKVFSHTQWVMAFAASAVLFWLSGPGIRLVDSTAGGFDSGYLQVPILAGAWYTMAIGWTFVALQLAFATLDNWIDAHGWRKAWITVAERDKRFAVWFTAAVLAALLSGYLVCLTLVALRTP